MINSTRERRQRLHQLERSLDELLGSAERMQESTTKTAQPARRLQTAARRALSAGHEVQARLALQRHLIATDELEAVARQLAEVRDELGRRLCELEVAVQEAASIVARVPERVEAADRLVRATLLELPRWLRTARSGSDQHR